jgi:DNA-directed RNA polymerase specialized sigma24 family protein
MREEDWGLVMAAAALRLGPSRDLLLQAIVASLESWPDLHRRIFSEIHYRGQSVSGVARVLGLGQNEVKEILRHCELDLYRAIKVFRDDTPVDLPAKPCHRLAGAACCFH